MTVRAAVYLRISQDPRETGLAIERQRADCLAIVEARGWALTKEYEETASASDRNKRRPRYDELVADFARGEFDALVCWDLDRLTRQPRQLEDWIDAAEERGLRLVTANGEADLATDGGRLYARIKASVSRGEMERKSARQKAAIRQAMEKGHPITGRKVIGWQSDGMTLVEEEATLVRETFDAVLAGASLSGTAKRWNDLGLRTSGTSRPDAPHSNGGGPWTPVAIRVLLTNPRYAGFRQDAAGKLYPGQWPAIVSEETWRAMVEHITHPSRRRTPGPERKHLLSSLAVCGLCGATMKAGGSRSGVPVYRCSSSAHLARKAGIIDDYIAERVIVRLTRRDAAELLRKTSAPDTEAIRSELIAKRSRRDGLVELVADGTMTASEVRSAKARLDAEIGDLEGRLSTAGRADVLGPLIDSDDARQAWDSLDLDRRRAVVDLLMVVTILPIGGGRHEKLKPQTIGIDWRL